MDLTDKNKLIDYLQSHGLYAKHGLGQNFLVDQEALDKIVEAAEIKTEDLVVEVGPGVGTLTQELVSRAGKVIAVEIDQKLSQLLNGYIAQLLEDEKITRQQYDNTTIVNSDILRANLFQYIMGLSYKVIANIPYYITSKIIELFLTAEKKPEIMVLLVQKEVAERICAKPGEMSTLSVSVQAYAEPEIVSIVKKESFFPSPKVDSAILRIRNIHAFNHPELVSGSSMIDSGSQATVRNDSSAEEKAFFRAVHIGFSSRRKTLLNNFSAGLHLPKEKASDIITKSGIDPNRRAQDLSIEEWSKLANEVRKFQ